MNEVKKSVLGWILFKEVVMHNKVEKEFLKYNNAVKFFINEIDLGIAVSLYIINSFTITYKGELGYFPFGIVFVSSYFFPSIVKELSKELGIDSRQIRKVVKMRKSIIYAMRVSRSPLTRNKAVRNYEDFSLSKLDINDIIRWYLFILGWVSIARKVLQILGEDYEEILQYFYPIIRAKEVITKFDEIRQRIDVLLKEAHNVYKPSVEYTKVVDRIVLSKDESTGYSVNLEIYLSIYEGRVADVMRGEGPSYGLLDLYVANEYGVKVKSEFNIWFSHNISDVE